MADSVKETETAAWTVTKTDAGKYDMGIVAGDFENTNENFADVKFEIVDGQLEIKPLEITEPRFDISDPDDTDYNGKEQKQPVTVTNTETGKVLTEGTDFTLAYSDDVTNAGTVTVTVEGIGNYTGKVDKTYNINQVKVHSIVEDISKVYDGEVLDASIEDYYEKGRVEGLVNGEIANVILNGKITHVEETTDFVEYKDGDGEDAVWYKVEWAKADEAEPAPDGRRASSMVLTAYAADRPIATALESNYEIDAEANEIGKLEITPAELTIKTEGGSKEYDGAPLTNKKVTLTGVVKADEDQIVVTATGSQTGVGSSKNTYEISWGDAKESDYTITEKLGILTVTEKPAPPEPPTPPPPTPPTPPEPPTPPDEPIEEPDVPQTEPEDIPDEPTPTTGGAWALINLISAICASLLSLGMLATYFMKKKEDEEEDENGQKIKRDDEEDEDNVKKHGLARLASLIPAIGSIVTFILTENMKNPMVLTDKWTVLMVVMALANVILAVLSKKKKEDKDEEETQKA